MGHHYNPDIGTSFPHYKEPYSNDYLVTQAPLCKTKLYSPALVNLDKQTQANIRQLKDKLEKIDPCYGLGQEFWHSRKIKLEGEKWSFDDSLDYVPPKWEETKTVFMKDDNRKDNANNAHFMCYLCTTLEEHQRHLARKGLRLKEKKEPKTRVHYVAPAPFVPKKKAAKKEKPAEVAYKVTVRTSNRDDAGTSAKVHIQIHGRKKSTDRYLLSRKRSVRFYFASRSEEVFHLRGPNIGDPRYITIEHDGEEKSQSWHLNEVEISLIHGSENQTWVFPCDQWLSLHFGDRRTKKDIKGVEKEKEMHDYKVNIITGQISKSGTNANVTLTLYDKKGHSQSFPLKDQDGEKNFRKGSERVFTITTEGLGPVSNIKIEHDDHGKNPCWFLEEVVLKDQYSRKELRFPCGDWLSSEDGGRTFRYLYPLNKKLKGKHKSNLNAIKYEVKVLTGIAQYAGTDAKVYIKMFGKSSSTEEMELANSDIDCFERGQTDNFTLRADDVGDLKKVSIRHDNSGLGAGWFLEELVVRRFFSKREVLDRIQSAEDRLDKRMRRREEEDEDEEVDRVRTNVSAEGTPKYEEYVFKCSQWLAEDEHDGRIHRTLKPNTVTTFFQKD